MNIDIKVTLPATAVCLIPWATSGFMFSFDWGAAFVICAVIDVTLYLTRKK